MEVNIMTKEYYRGNRERLYASMKESSVLILFSGSPVRKTNDEFYPFYTSRNFLYLQGPGRGRHREGLHTPPGHDG